MFLSALALAFPANWATAANEAAPCTVKAWVRADDLWPDAVSYGELKVKISQPCAETVQSVALRLRLDESAEQTVLSNTTTSGEFWDWAGDVPSPEWTTTRHTRTAWKIEKTVYTAEGQTDVEFAFAVRTPNINYPPAQYPLMFSRSNSDSERVAFIRAYRYSAFVGLATPSGDQRFVEVPAGFTAFQPVTQRSAINAKPHEVVVEAVSKNAPWKCPHASPSSQTRRPADESGDDAEKRISLRVAMPGGATAVQGQDFTVVVSLPGEEDSRSPETTYTYSSRLELDIRPTFAQRVPERVPESRKPARRMHLGSFDFEELHARAWATAEVDYRTRCEAPLSAPLSVQVPEAYPRTSTGSDSGAPFAVTAELVLSLTERRDAAHMNPLYDHSIECPSAGCPPPEDGWEFGACDSAQHTPRTYTARIPLTVVGRHIVDASAPVKNYLDLDGEFAARAPCFAIPPEASCEFGNAAPVETRGSRNGPAPVSNGDPFLRRYRMESGDPKAGQYVGALWQSKMHRLETKLVPLAFPGEAGAGQLTMDRPRT